MYIKSSGNYIHDIGLVINPFGRGGEGATPDAKCCENSVTDILEIKCPYSVRVMSMDEACEKRGFL